MALGVCIGANVTANWCWTRWGASCRAYVIFCLKRSECLLWFARASSSHVWICSTIVMTLIFGWDSRWCLCNIRSKPTEIFVIQFFKMLLFVERFYYIGVSVHYLPWYLCLIISRALSPSNAQLLLRAFDDYIRIQYEDFDEKSVRVNRE